MGKYTTALLNVLKIFSTTEWLDEGITTHPQNYVTDLTNISTFIRVDVIPSGLIEKANHKAVRGIILIDIFVESGKGPLGISNIADVLDTYLAHKSIQTPDGVTQLFTSSLATTGLDPDNHSYYRAKYEIPFLHFGV